MDGQRMLDRSIDPGKMDEKLKSESMQKRAVF